MSEFNYRPGLPNGHTSGPEMNPDASPTFDVAPSSSRTAPRVGAAAVAAELPGRKIVSANIPQVAPAEAANPPSVPPGTVRVYTYDTAGWEEVVGVRSWDEEASKGAPNADLNAAESDLVGYGEYDQGEDVRTTTIVPVDTAAVVSGAEKIEAATEGCRTIVVVNAGKHLMAVVHAGPEGVGDTVAEEMVTAVIDQVPEFGEAGAVAIVTGDTELYARAGEGLMQEDLSDPEALSDWNARIAAHVEDSGVSVLAVVGNGRGKHVSCDSATGEVVVADETGAVLFRYTPDIPTYMPQTPEVVSPNAEVLEALDAFRMDPGDASDYDRIIDGITQAINALEFGGIDAPPPSADATLTMLSNLLAGTHDPTGVLTEIIARELPFLDSVLHDFGERDDFLLRGTIVDVVEQELAQIEGQLTGSELRDSERTYLQDRQNKLRQVIVNLGWEEQEE